MVAVPHGEKADLDQVREDFPFLNIINAHCKDKLFHYSYWGPASILIGEFSSICRSRLEKSLEIFCIFGRVSKIFAPFAVKSLEITC